MKFSTNSVAISDMFPGFVIGDGSLELKNQIRICLGEKGDLPSFAPAERDNVIKSILEKAPIGVISVMIKKDGSQEIMDGRRRMAAIQDFMDGKFDVEGTSYKGLGKSGRVEFDSYQAQVCYIEGSAGELYDWFRRINTIESKRSDSWLFSHTYGGKWLDDVNRVFSEDTEKYDNIFGALSPAERVSRVIDWAANREDISAEEYMSMHQGDSDASSLRRYFESVVGWVTTLFGPETGKLIGQEWGEWYNDYSREFDESKALGVQGQVSKLLTDPDVTCKSGIVEYILTGDMSVLKLRRLSDTDKAAALARQGGKCAHCGCDLDVKSGKATLTNPWPHGSISPENTEVLCRKCDNIKKKRIMQAFG